jgi:hypothetical protein
VTRRCWWLMLSLIFCACEEHSVECSCSNNDPPSVWLAAGPPEGSTVDNPVHFYWGGWDSDGSVWGFEYQLIPNPTGTFNPSDSVGVPWAPVGGTDSTFTAEPDSLNTARSFTFFVRTVDNEGLRSLQPAYRTFSIR